MNSSLNFEIINTSEFNKNNLTSNKKSSLKNEKKPDNYEFTINDLNNFYSADRKLIINDSLEFWVHDNALKKASSYFNHMFSKSTDEYVVKNDIKFPKTIIYIPHHEYFFDILTWIYSRDGNRLSMSADEPESLLCILNLAFFLELTDSFFKVLLEQCEIKLDEDLLSNKLWSRFSFTFQILLNLIALMPSENYYLKILALLSWLKEDNTRKNYETNETINEREYELLTSKEFLQIKNYIQDKGLIKNLNVNELNLIQKRFSNIIPVLDNTYLIENYIIKSKIKIICRVCRRIGYSIQDFICNDCEIKQYHPKNFITIQRHLNQVCEHDGCKRKFSINEYSCCHKGPHIEGCVTSEGRHVLQFEINVE